MSPAPRRVVGIDGGGTRTRLLLADSTGQILGQREGGGGLLGVGDEEQVGDQLVREVRALAESTGEPLPVAVLCAGLAGVAGREEARRRLEARLVERDVARRVCLVSDAEVAFTDAFGEGPGILLVAGTGSIALARSEEGDPLRRVGGWGALLGDEGSGYGIGLAALRAAIRGSEARGPTTLLTGVVLEALGLDSVSELGVWVDTAEKADFAALAPRVLEAADGGDAVSLEIVKRAVESLMAHVGALRSGGGGVPRFESAPRVALPGIALVGGLIEPGGPLRRRVVERLKASGARPLEKEVQPARGAVEIALRR